MDSLVRNLEVQQDNLESKEKEKETLLGLLEENRTKISELDEKIEKSSKNIELSEEKKLLKSEQAKNKITIETNRDLLKRHMANLWRQPLYHALKPLIKKMTNEIGELKEKNQNLLFNKKKVEEMKESINTNNCFECGATLSTSKIDDLNRIVEHFDTAHDNYEQNDERIQKLQAEVNGVQMDIKDAVLYAETSKYMEIGQELTKRNIDIDNRLFDITNELANFDEAEGRSIKREYNQRNIQIGTLGAQVDNVEKEIEKINYEIAQIKNSPAFKTVKGDEKTEKASELTENLKKIFDAARNGYRIICEN